MSVKAFILITTKVGKSREVLSRLREIDSIEAVDSVLGPYDIIAIAKANDVNLHDKLFLYLNNWWKKENLIDNSKINKIIFYMSNIY